MKTIIQKIPLKRHVTEDNKIVLEERQGSEFLSPTTKAEALHSRDMIGWRATRREDRDVDGFEFWQFDFLRGGIIADSELVGYKELPDA